jgi:cytochrome c5
MTSTPARCAAAFLSLFAVACSERNPPSNEAANNGSNPPVEFVKSEATLPPFSIHRPRPIAPTENERLILEGKNTFRFDTFGDEAFWGAGGLELQRSIVGAGLGGVGLGVSPTTALSVGLKVDAAALPEKLVTSIKAGEVDLSDPAVTVELLKLNAVVGLKGTVEGDRLTSVGITCALCHSTVDDSFAPGIGQRLDGWANRDLNVGAIINLAESLEPVARVLGVDEGTVRTVLQSWGPGRFDALLFIDGKAFRPDGKTAAVLLPPAFGLAGVNLHTSTGFGSVPYWNAFVAVLEMRGQGNFTDERLDDATQFPVAARNKLGHTRVENDLVTPKLPGLQAYQLSLRAPAAPQGTFNADAAARGAAVFNGDARCSSCHTQPLLTEAGYNMHKPAEIGIDDFQANRSPEKRYRTTPLRGLWTHQKGGFYHDGRFATLDEVVSHYQRVFDLQLTEGQRTDLIAYLLSI